MNARRTTARCCRGPAASRDQKPRLGHAFSGAVSFPRALRSQGFVYEGALRAGQYDPKLSVVLEDVGGQWKVSQWL
jgi:hypothetical protein